MGAVPTGELVAAIDRYLLTLEGAGYSQHTLKSYSTRLLDYARHCGDDAELRQDSQVIQAYLAALRNRRLGRRVGVSSSTLAHAFAILSGFYRFAERTLGVEPNPMRDVVKPRGESSVDTEYRALTSAELDTLMETARHGWSGDDMPADLRSQSRRIEDALLIALMGLAGLRVSELCGLDASDFDGDVVRVIGKGRKARSVPLAPEILELLALHEAPSARPHLFGLPTSPDRRLTPNSVEQRIPRLAQRAGIFEPRVTPHVLRHTFGSMMLAADPTALIPTRDLMGHESIETTNKYAHTREEARRLALASLHELRNREPRR